MRRLEDAALNLIVICKRASLKIVKNRNLLCSQKTQRKTLDDADIVLKFRFKLMFCL